LRRKKMEDDCNNRIEGADFKWSRVVKMQQAVKRKGMVFQAPGASVGIKARLLRACQTRTSSEQTLADIAFTGKLNRCLAAYISVGDTLL